MPEESLIKKIELPIKRDERGDLVFLESGNQIPFEIKRVFYLTNLKENGKRGFHAHKSCNLVLICIQGSALIKLDDGERKEEIMLNQNSVGLLIEKKIWHSMENFAPGTILLVLSSEHYSEDDYLRDYDQFLDFIKK